MLVFHRASGSTVPHPCRNLSATSTVHYLFRKRMISKDSEGVHTIWMSVHVATRVREELRILIAPIPIWALHLQYICALTGSALFIKVGIFINMNMNRFMKYLVKTVICICIKYGYESIPTRNSLWSFQGRNRRNTICLPDNLFSTLSEDAKWLDMTLRSNWRYLASIWPSGTM